MNRNITAVPGSICTPQPHTCVNYLPCAYNFKNVFISVRLTAADWTGHGLTRGCSALLSHLWNAERTFFFSHIGYRVKKKQTRPIKRNPRPREVACADLWASPGQGGW